MTRSPSVSAALQRLRDQVKIEATVLLDAARELAKSLPTIAEVADAFAPVRVERRHEVERSELDRAAARRKANRLYKAAMSQASQPDQDATWTPEEERLHRMAECSFEAADKVMRDAGMDPAEHPRRAMAARRLTEQGVW